MKRREGLNACSLVVLLLAMVACSSPPDEEERVDQVPPAMQEVAAPREELESPTDETERPEVADAIADVADTSGEVAEPLPGGPPQGIAAAPEAETPQMKNWMLIEFASAVRDADLEWLEGNGFHVDTLMSSTLVRGWLELPEGGEAIAQDPRVARIHAQMR